MPLALYDGIDIRREPALFALHCFAWPYSIWTISRAYFDLKEEAERNGDFPGYVHETLRRALQYLGAILLGFVLLVVFSAVWNSGKPEDDSNEKNTREVVA